MIFGVSLGWIADPGLSRSPGCLCSSDEQQFKSYLNLNLLLLKKDLQRAEYFNSQFTPT